MNIIFLNNYGNYILFINDYIDAELVFLFL